ncbi:MAG: hypothetical protein D6690_11365 [Nitrospirae bacterium]|nr:MAG: hypothetical protein D6690_11365 [Nitrospirota bacterium]
MPMLPDPTPVLLAKGLAPEEITQCLAPYGFQHLSRADANLQAMANEPGARRALAAILPELLAAVAETADPDQALNEWERYLASGIHRVQLFQYLAQAPRMLHLVCTIFGNSPAMAQTLIRDPFLIYWLGDEHVLECRPSARILKEELTRTLSNFQTKALKLEALRRFKRREMLRIGIRDLLRLADLQETVTALSDLAALVVQAAYDIIRHDLINRFGPPYHRRRGGIQSETQFVVLGMGKFGGWELNYSSDIDLIYLYESSDGRTHATFSQREVSNEVFFETLAKELTQALTEATSEGALYRVDLRLRPEGSVGPLAQAMDTALRYYRQRGRAWEKMAFLKAAPVAGSYELGRRFLRRLRRVFWESASSDEEIVRTVRTLKAQIDAKMIRRNERERNVKLGEGGIREIEFLVQALQWKYASRYPRLLERNTLKALRRLARYGLLPSSAASQLAQDYIFLRQIEHKLQMVNDLQTHVLPTAYDDLKKCAIRLGYAKSAPGNIVDQFLQEYRACTQRVNAQFIDLCTGKIFLADSCSA